MQHLKIEKINKNSLDETHKFLVNNKFQCQIETCGGYIIVKWLKSNYPNKAKYSEQ
jgi:hypothetical protein